MGQLTLVINSADSADTLNAFVNPQEGNQKPTLTGIENLISAMNGGMKDIEDGLVIFGVPAIATVTFTGAPTAAQLVTINGVAFTARASGAVANEFNIGGSVTITATNLAAAINASVTDGVSGCVVASSDAGVVTITSLVTGKLALGYTISENLSNATLAAFALPSAETSRTSF
jgi:hypothetical protein